MLFGGIVIVIGVMIDVVIVMIENVYKYLEVYDYVYLGELFMVVCCWEFVVVLVVEVGFVLFFLLLIIMLLFVLVFLLEG